MPKTIIIPRAILAALLAILLPAFALAAQPGAGDRVRVQILPDAPAARPGDQRVVAISFAMDPGWHIQTQSPVVPPELAGLEPVATTIDATATNGLRLGPIQWPTPKRVATAAFGTPLEMDFFVDGAVAFVPIIIDQNAVGEASVTLLIGWQACDDRICLPPEDRETTIQFVIDPNAAATSPPPAFAAFDPRVFADMLANPAATTNTDAPAQGRLEINTFGLKTNLDTQSFLGVAALLGLAFVGGFILNLTPCVLPVIPLKIMGLTRHAGNPRRTILLGVVMSLGVVFFWLAIGVGIAGIKAIGAVSELFGNPWLGLGVGAFIAIMALGMMGLFTIQLPNSVQGYAPTMDTIPGSFMFGIMTAVLGTPCFGPFAGAAAAWAATAPITLALAVFTSVGAGMALPYLVLAMKPSWASKVPRTGPASELVKQVMGLLLLASAAYFVGTALIGLIAEKPYLAGVLHWWFVALFALAAGLLLLVRTFQITRSPARRGIFGILAILISGAAILWANSNTNTAAANYTPSTGGEAAKGPWKPYSAEAFDAAIARGDVVVIDFTAAWCLNCQVLKATVLNRPEVQAALQAPGVLALEADLTSRKAPGWAKLRDLGEVGIPLLSVHGPGRPTPWKSNAYTPSDVLAAIQAAGGSPVGQRP